jgi:hypothetical protein
LVAFDHYVLDWHIVCVLRSYLYLDQLLALMIQGNKSYLLAKSSPTLEVRS